MHLTELVKDKKIQKSGSKRKSRHKVRFSFYKCIADCV